MKKIFIFISMFCFCMICNSKEYDANTINTASESIKKEVDFVNMNMAGKKFDETTTLLSCAFDGKNIKYTYEMDESKTTIAEIKKAGGVKLMKALVNDGWNGSNPAMKEIKKNLKIVGGHVEYRYIGSSTNETIAFTIDIK